MSHKVKCVYCGITFDRDIIPCVSVGRRYAHIECSVEHENNKTQDEKDREELEEYIRNLLGASYNYLRIRQQLKIYYEQYKYTSANMLKALTYAFEVKKNNIDKANGGIGIIPYVYNEALLYYKTLQDIKEANEKKNINNYTIPVTEIVIPVPKRKIKKKKIFTFLDEEEVL